MIYASVFVLLSLLISSVSNRYVSARYAQSQGMSVYHELWHQFPFLLIFIQIAKIQN
jgi:hypothetical protein